MNPGDEVFRPLCTDRLRPSVVMNPGDEVVRLLCAVRSRPPSHANLSSHESRRRGLTAAMHRTLRPTHFTCHHHTPADSSSFATLPSNAAQSSGPRKMASRRLSRNLPVQHSSVTESTEARWKRLRPDWYEGYSAEWTWPAYEAVTPLAFRGSRSGPITAAASQTFARKD